MTQNYFKDMKWTPHNLNSKQGTPTKDQVCPRLAMSLWRRVSYYVQKLVIKLYIIKVFYNDGLSF